MKLANLLRWIHPTLEPAGLHEANEAMKQAEASAGEARARFRQVRKAVDPRYASATVQRVVDELDDADAAIREALGDDDQG